MKRTAIYGGPRVRKLQGVTTTINSQSFVVHDRDTAGNVSLCTGSAVPTDAGSGFAIGAIFRKTTGNGIGSTVYINEGSASSCDFNAVASPEVGDIAGVTAGNGLSGGGTTGTVSLAVQQGKGIYVDGTGVHVGVQVYNATGGLLAAGTLVYLSGYDSTNGITIAKADADAGLFATHVVTQDIGITNAGVVYPVARVTGMNTGGRTIGDAVYLDATTSGGFTFSAPTGADQGVQIVGYVKVVNASTGEIEFFPGARYITKFPTSSHQDGSLTPAKQTSAGRTRHVVIPFTLPALSGSDQLGLGRANFVSSQAWTLVSVNLFSTVATTGSDATNHYEFMARNVTAAANLHTVTTSTQGAEISTSAAKAITVSQNLSFTAGQVFQLNVDIKDDGSAGPTGLSAANLSVVLEYTI